MAKKINNATDLNPDDIIGTFARRFGKKNNKNIIASINDDDCAVMRIGKEEIVISSDYLNANPIALEFKIATYFDIGKLLVAANLSDLCGSGAKPLAFLASLMFDKTKASQHKALELMSGISTELNKLKVPLVGGDTKLGNSDAFCGTAIGFKEKGTKLFLKNAARAGDSIWVSGKIGSVAAAIDILQEKSAPALKKWARNKIITPSLPLVKSRKAAKTKLVNGGTDLSDGLGSDLAELCRSSGVGAIVDVSKIPVDKNVSRFCAKKGTAPWKYALTIGGDFQFIITSKATKLMQDIGFIEIGKITKSKKLNLSVNGYLHDFPIQGHSDYKKSSFKNEIKALLSKLNIE